MGERVRWNNKDKLSPRLISWAEENEIDLVPVCPENELLGTPRAPIRLIQIDEEVLAMNAGSNIHDDLDEKCSEILDRHQDACGFIGISKSPSCGVSVGVKNLGRTIKGFMHQNASIPTTELGHLKNKSGQEIFLKRIEKHERLKCSETH